MEKIDLVEILKDCPKGMELDCTVYDNVTLEYVHKLNSLPICVRIQNRGTIFLSKYGQFNDEPYCKCVIFPKGKTTWEGFIPPCKFKAGDVLVSEQGNIVLFSHIDSKNIVHYHCIIPTFSSFRIEENTSIGVGRYYECVLANEQQRQRMYDKIKCSGYKYNQQLNKLEKLIEPKFKVGDMIRYKRGNKVKRIIVSINNKEEFYHTDDEGRVYFKYQDDWELVPNKFDINTLKPFESRVLMRNTELDKWSPGIWGYYDKPYSYPYKLIGTISKQCIPYEGNEHLLGKTDDCSEFYKTWE